VLLVDFCVGRPKNNSAKITHLTELLNFEASQLICRFAGCFLLRVNSFVGVGHILLQTTLKLLTTLRLLAKDTRSYQKIPEVNSNRWKPPVQRTMQKSFLK